MVMLAYASVPLYRLFCQVTGFGGTTQVSAGPSGKLLDRQVTVRFDANTSPGLPWSFQPEQRAVTVQVGEQNLAFYRATNNGSEPIVGTATFNVTPDKAGIYFNKVACFCFTEQKLAPGESMDFPVSFFVDPAIAGDRKLDDVHTITLSYTFFRAEPKARVSMTESR